jgi:hypothetical protein
VIAKGMNTFPISTTPMLATLSDLLARFRPPNSSKFSARGSVCTSQLPTYPAEMLFPWRDIDIFLSEHAVTRM